MKNTIKYLLGAAVVGAAFFSSGVQAQAYPAVNWSINVGTGGPVGVYSPAPVYGAYPAPVMVRPAPVYVAPAPVQYVAPAYYAPPGYYHRGHGHGYGHGKHHWNRYD